MYNYGKMVANTKAIGSMTMRMGTEDSSMQMAISIKEIGSMTGRTEGACMCTWTEQNIMATGIQIYSMDTEWKCGLMAQHTRAIMSEVKNTV